MERIAHSLTVIVSAALLVVLYRRIILVVRLWLLLHLAERVRQSHHFRRLLLEAVCDTHRLEAEVLYRITMVHLLHEEGARVPIHRVDRGERLLKLVLIGSVAVDCGQEDISLLLLLILVIVHVGGLLTLHLWVACTTSVTKICVRLWPEGTLILRLLLR